MLVEIYESHLRDKEDFNKFINSFLDEILPKNVDKRLYIDSFINYLFYNDDTFLYRLKYLTFRQVDSDYLDNLFNGFIRNNKVWLKLLLKSCDDKNKIDNVIAQLGNKKLDIIKTIVMPSFKSLEMDIKNSEIVTSMLNSILNNTQKFQKQQNEMFANISHEMRTPLNSVIGYLDVLDNMQTLTLEERKYVSYAKNSSKILLTLINDLLDTQKLHNAQLDLTNNPFWVNKIIKNAVLISSINANNKDIELIYNDKTSIYSEAIGDKNRFLQILNNILSNAVKFTPKGGRIVITATSQEVEDKIKVCVEVSDNGIGIPKEKQKELFKPFSRITTKERGTGLGLFISKQLAQKMGGDIWFESEEGKGTTFYIEVEFKKSESVYNKDILKDRNILIFSKKNCSNLSKQLIKSGANVMIFDKSEEFMKYLMFNDNTDMVIFLYPNELEEDDMDNSLIKTYKKLYTNKKTYFVACIEEAYPKNYFIFDKVINFPITMLEIIEIFSKDSKVIEKYRYLIVDDEPMNRMVLSTMIKTFDKNGIIDIATNGEEGLDKLKSNQYDIVFLDKRMPKMGGYEVLEELKKLNIKQNIYLLTADGDSETMKKAKEYNIGYIAKPVTLTTLKAAIADKRIKDDTII